MQIHLCFKRVFLLRTIRTNLTFIYGGTSIKYSASDSEYMVHGMILSKLIIVIQHVASYRG